LADKAVPAVSRAPAQSAVPENLSERQSTKYGLVYAFVFANDCVKKFLRRT
jgi:hypothetical protein